LLDFFVIFFVLLIIPLCGILREALMSIKGMETEDKYTAEQIKILDELAAERKRHAMRDIIWCLSLEKHPGGLQ